MTVVAPTDDVLLATVRDFTDRSGAQRVVVLLDRGTDRSPPAIEGAPGEPLTISAGEENLIVPPVDLIGVEPVHVHLPPKPVPAAALHVDATTGRVEAPIGAMDALAGAVTALARAMGGRSVAVADFATRSGESLWIAARPGEPVVLTFGEEQFELPTSPGGTV